MNSIIQSLDEHINELCYSSLINIMEKVPKVAADFWLLSPNEFQRSLAWKLLSVNIFLIKVTIK